jgi:hypothetical protein
MSDPVNTFLHPTFNATLVSYPDFYLTEDSPKIFFLGSGKDWKSTAINHYSSNWLDRPIVMCFYEEDTTEEIMPWILYNTSNSDFILYHLEGIHNQLDILLLGLLASKSNVFISTANIEQLKMVRILLSEFNNHIILDNVEDRLETLKKIWNYK